MFEKFLRENAADFRQRYQGTYGFFRNGTKPPMLTKITVVDDRVYFQDKRGVGYELEPDSTEDIGFSFIPPKSAWYNTDQGAMWVQRKASRQFSRGISDATVSISHLSSKGAVGTSVSFKNLEKIFGSPPDKMEAFQNFVDKKTPSVALSEQFAVAWAQNLLLVNNHQIGDFTLEGTKFKFNLGEERQMFQTELTDALRGTKYQAEFV